ncbi:MAG: Type 1 glutamine amidotransferase-like domain-containing protein [Candidatus Roizmanbacteria bacterium]|nr:Type 1 glutamine amidotransferase-like domain-containing protein [Candidatus Roizmanbacteria bacterium]
MKLLLTSSGITNKSIEKALRELLDKSFKEACVVFVPTAANGEAGDKSWLVNDMNNFRILGFKSFEIIDIAVVPQNIWLPRFKNADVLVFGGGDQKYLLTQMRESGLENELQTMLQSKVYVGISAGSMVTAQSITLSYTNILYYEKEGRFEDIDGLGYVDFEIRPHLNSKWFPKVNIPYLSDLAKKHNRPFYAIDDASAVVVDREKVRVVSEGTWKKFN